MIQLSGGLFDLTTLGRIDLTSGERGSIRTLLAQPKRLALLAYLLVEAPGSFVSRDSLLAVFWPEADEARARASLRQALQFLRRTLGDAAVVTRGDNDVGIDQAVVTCDAVALRRAIRDGDDRSAVDQYRGPFLGGMIVDETPELERWISNTRRALEHEVAAAAGRLAEQHAVSSPSIAVEHARFAVELAPFDESAARRLAQLLDRSGDRAGALREIDALRARLDEELAVLPSPETLEFDRALRARTASRHAIPASANALDTSSGVSAASSPIATNAKELGVEPETAPRASRISYRVFLAASALTVAIFSWFAFTQWRSKTPNRSSDSGPVVVNGLPRVVVAPFDNQTGDSAWSALGAMTAGWVTEGLSRVNGLRIVPLTATTATTRALGVEVRNDTSTLLTQVARELGATVLVSGAVFRTGASLHFQAQVVDIASGALLGRAETVSVPEDSVMAGIDRLRTRIVATLAPLGDTVSHLRRAVTPPSYEAYRDYIAGLEAFVQGDPQRALRYYERSSSIDTSYPMPRIASTIMLLNLDLVDSAAKLVNVLAESREQLGPLERATLDMVQGVLRGDLAGMERAAREQARIAPGSIGEYMVAEISRRRGNPRAAVTVLRALGPEKGELRGWRAYWRELTASLHMIGDHEAELAAARQALQLYPRDIPVRGYAVRALAALGRRDAIDSLVGSWTTDASLASGSDVLYHIAANVFAARGDTAATTYYRSRELHYLSQHVGPARTNAVRLRHVRALLLNGSVSAARDSLRQLDTSPPTMDALGLSATAAAMSGDSSAVSATIERMRRLDAERSAAVRAVSEADVLYWQSVVAAQRKDAQGFANLLRQAFASGRSVGPALFTDPFLAPIRSSVEYRTLLRGSQ